MSSAGTSMFSICLYLYMFPAFGVAGSVIARCPLWGVFRCCVAAGPRKSTRKGVAFDVSLSGGQHQHQVFLSHPHLSFSLAAFSFLCP